MTDRVKPLSLPLAIATLVAVVIGISLTPGDALARHLGSASASPPCASLCEPPPEVENPSPAELAHSLLVLNVGWDTGSPATSPGLIQGDAAFNAAYLDNQVNDWYAKSAPGLYAPWKAFVGGDLAIAAPHFQNPADPLSCNAEQLVEDVAAKAEATARARGVNPDLYTAVVLTWWNLPLCGVDGYRVGRHIMFTYPGLTPHHELGHYFGIDHAKAISCVDGSGAAVPLSTNCTQLEYGDRYDLMGHGSGAFNAVYANQLGWIGGQFESMSAGDYTRTVTLKPFTEIPHGLRAIRLQNGSSTLWLEYRRPVGIDSPDYLGTRFVPTTPGLIVHREIRGANGRPVSQLLDMTPAPPSAPDTFADAGLPVGQTWVDPLGEMKITLNSATGSGATVTISSQRITVPEVIGLTQAKASSTLTGAGLAFGGSEEVVDPNCDFIGTVKSQSPAPGARLMPGQAVSVKIGKEKKKGLCN